MEVSWIRVPLGYNTKTHGFRWGLISDELRDRSVRSYAATRGPAFIIMFDNGRSLTVLIVDDYLECEEDCTCGVAPPTGVLTQL